MNQTNYLRLFSFFAFLVFGAVSCWATAESLHLLLASWPKIFCYLVAIGFFVVASIGTKMIVDSLNQKIYVENRRGRLFGGVFLVLIFWLAISMPTNTHTFIYRSVIGERVNNDILKTESYLSDIINNTINQEKTIQEINHLQQQAASYLVRVNQEIDQYNDPGDGPRTKAVIEEANQFAVRNGIGYQIQPRTSRGRSQQELTSAKGYYDQQFTNMNAVIEERCHAQMQGPSVEVKNKASESYAELENIRTRIENKSIDLNSAEDLYDKVLSPLEKAYSIIQGNTNFIKWHNNDAALYTASPIVTQSRRMVSVFEVWGDYMAGRFGGHGFFWWILLAVLVDIAAFIFFDLTFKKREY